VRAVTPETVTAAEVCVQLVREANALRSLPSGTLNRFGRDDENVLFWGVGSTPQNDVRPDHRTVAAIRAVRADLGRGADGHPLPFPLEAFLVAPLYARPETRVTIAGELRSRTSCVVTPGVGYGPTGNIAEWAIPSTFYHVTVGGGFGFYAPDSSPTNDSTG
jgi:hypothetical protein